MSENILKSKEKEQMDNVRVRFWIFLAVTLVFYILMRWLSGGLSGEEIVAFELAKTEAVVSQLMAGWDSLMRDRFLWSIYIDYPLLCSYAGFLFYACRYAAKKSGHGVIRGAGIFFAWLGPVAAGMDAMENAGMLYTINRGVVDAVVHFTYDMAVVKFSLLGIMALFLLAAVVFRLLHAFTKE